MSTNVSTTTYCDPQHETDYGIAGVLHWQHIDEEDHCLMRLTFRTETPVIVLSALISSPAKESFLTQVAPAANAAYSIIKDRVTLPTNITWITHAGPFSTPDTLWSSGIEEFGRVHLQWNGNEFEADTPSDYECIPLVDPFLKTLELEPVNEILKQLGWRNWRDDW
ncbi:MAG: hypothetical protein AAFW84_30050 [Cyanobacteria bacterium J06635_15]